MSAGICACTGLPYTKSPFIPSRGRWSRLALPRSQRRMVYMPRIVPALPCRRSTNKAVVEETRDRVLTAAELRLVWQLAGSNDFGAIVRLLVLTGQRREEVGGMLWSELDLDAALWTIGKDRTKNGLQHDVPLSPPAVAILRSIPQRDDRDFVFGSSNGPFQGWSNAKAALDARM